MERRGDDTRPRYVVEVCIGCDEDREREEEARKMEGNRVQGFM
jgi:hypothetical protein